MRNLTYRIRGGAEAEIFGVFPESVVNRCVSAGIALRRVSVLNGRALVQPGKAVQAGETLVTGTLDSLTGPARFVRARGEILTDTWYELTAVCPPAERGKGRSAGKLRRFAQIFGEKRVNFYGNSGKTLDGYDKIMHDYILGIEGLFAVPIRLVCETYVLRPDAELPAAPGNMAPRLEQYLAGRIDGEITERSYAEWERDGARYVTMRARCFENNACIQQTNQAEAASP